MPARPANANAPERSRGSAPATACPELTHEPLCLVAPLPDASARQKASRRTPRQKQPLPVTRSRSRAARRARTNGSSAARSRAPGSGLLRDVRVLARLADQVPERRLLLTRRRRDVRAGTGVGEAVDQVEQGLRQQV